MKTDKKRENLIRFIPFYKKHAFFLIIDLICAGLTTASEIVLPLIVRYLTDIGLNSPEMLTLRLILACSGLYLSLKAVDLTAYYFMCYQGHVIGTKIETDMRSKLFNHLQKLSFSFYTETKIGQIMARITSDLFDVTEFAHHCPEEFFIAFLKALVSFIILIRINVPLTLIMFLVIPVMLFIMAKYNFKLRETFRKQRVALGEINAQVEDSLLGVRVVKSFSREQKEIEKFEKGNDALFKTKKASYKNMGSFNTLTRAFDGVMYVVVVGFGAFFMMKKQIAPADLTVYLLYTSMLIASIRRVVEFTEQFQRGMTGIDRYFEIMDTEPEIYDSENAVEFDGKDCNIVFENVSFKYADEQEKVLDGINLEIKQGSHIALVGPSGGGKTTMCNLIPRFYDVTEGKITIGGQDVKQYTLSSLRNNIGVVMQDVYLFSGTIFENIAYGKQGATMDEVISAAKKAGCHDFICNLSDGYLSYVGERGIKLSGGQKQRISIARVFLKDPPILILDEATSALDNQSEFLVQDSLEKLAMDRTTITVAHRLSTIENSDEIIVLDQDKICEKGSHKSLLKKKGVYYQLYEGYKNRK
ncbi:MAG: ABC transporter ATP-binding protein [Christensenellaceae bacterium]